MAFTVESLCKHVYRLGFDMFNKGLSESDLIGQKPIDKDKLCHVISCEKKRLQRFAREFPHEQHLLNLQSLLVGALANLARLLSDQTACISQYHRELHRIAVLVQEIDNALAKAKFRKRCALVNNIIQHQLEAEAVILAAEKARDDQKEHRVLAASNRLALQIEQEEKVKEQARRMQEKIAQIFQQLQQYRLHIQRIIDAKVSQEISRRIEQRIQLMVENNLRTFLDEMDLDSPTKEAILARTIEWYQQEFSSYRTPSLRMF